MYTGAEIFGAILEFCPTKGKWEFGLKKEIKYWATRKTKSQNLSFP